jgi:hypothetical protein
MNNMRAAAATANRERTLIVYVIKREQPKINACMDARLKKDPPRLVRCVPTPSKLTSPFFPELNAKGNFNVCTRRFNYFTRLELPALNTQLCSKKKGALIKLA